MRLGKKVKVVFVLTLIMGLAIGTVATALGYGPFSSKAAGLSSYFQTNGVGVGKSSSITIDGNFSDWNESMLVAQGVANDDCRAFRGPHEGPVYDTYALYASWDNSNLYLMWEITNLTDVVAPEQDYPKSDNGKPWNGDIPQVIALDIDGNKSGDGTITSDGKGIWGMNIGYQDGTDTVLCFSSKKGVGTPAMFTMDANGGFSYAEEYCQGFKDLGISFAYGDGHISKNLYGINMNGYTGLTTDMMSDDSAAWTDLNTLGHSEAQDTMYEMVIPMSALGIDKDYLESNGIGVRHISTFGKSAIQSIPVDATIYDNASEPYAADDSTSAEKEDDDLFTTDMARIGKSNGGTVVKTIAPKTEDPTPLVSENPVITDTPVTTSPATITPATSTPVVTDEYYGKADNNNHSGETAYTITQKSGSSSSTSIKYAADKMSDGTILHAWCWSFNTIKNNMADIKKAGYTSVQTSPVSECKYGNGGDKSIRNWYFHYQPTNYAIGNYQLGSEQEFKEMCSVAEQYGVSVIVDAIPNHMTSDWGAINSKYQNRSYYHTNQEVGSWQSRHDITQQAVLGLWDVNTQSTEAQQNVLNYLKRCVADGADGFRYDTAKHIELPDDSGFGGNFWPVALNNGSKFQYGEVLQDDNSSLSREDAYSKYMSVTGSKYGYTIRDAVANNNLSTGKIMNYNISADSSKVVTWVESHDNFANDNCETVWVTNEQVKLAWAVLAARSSTTPLFFNRPVGAGGTNYDSRFPGKSQIGDAGDSFYKDDEIAAVNLFRNSMEGEAEYLRNINGQSILSIERGTKGQVIINSNYSSQFISSATKLANGTYTNMTDDNSVFTVSNGNITGTLPSRSVVVLYKATPDNTPSVGINGYSDSVNNTFKFDYLNLSLTTSNSTNATYSINGGTSYKFTNGKTIKIGWGVAAGTVIKVKVDAENNTASATKTYTFVKKDQTAGLKIAFTKPSDWSNKVYAYVYKENGSEVSQLAAWPGIAMTVEGGYYVLDTDDDSYDGAYVIFSDGNTQVPAAQQTGFIVKNGYRYTKDGPVEPVVTPTPVTPTPVTPTPVTPTPVPPTGTTTIQFVKPSGWGNDIYAYVYQEDDSVKELAKWPGTKMDVVSGNIYRISFISMYNGANVIFTDGSNQVPAAQQPGFVIKDNSRYDSNGYVGPIPGEIETTPTPSGDKMVIYYYSGWSNANIHYKAGDSAWTTAPGVSMSASGISGYYKAEIDMGSATTLKACFNNGNGTWDNNGGNDYSLNSVGTYTIKNGNVTSGAPSVSSEANTVTIYYKTNWSAYCHYQVGGGDWTAAPGVRMSAASVSGYQTITIDLGSASSMTACFNDGNGNWDNHSGNNYSIPSKGTYTIINGNITAGNPQ